MTVSIDKIVGDIQPQRKAEEKESFVSTTDTSSERVTQQTIRAIAIKKSRQDRLGAN